MKSLNRTWAHNYCGTTVGSCHVISIFEQGKLIQVFLSGLFAPYVRRGKFDFDVRRVRSVYLSFSQPQPYSTGCILGVQTDWRFGRPSSMSQPETTHSVLSSVCGTDLQSKLYLLFLSLSPDVCTS